MSWKGFSSQNTNLSAVNALHVCVCVLFCDQSSLMQVKALYDFTAEETDELGFNAGDVIEVLEQTDNSWWKGRLRGRCGLIPANYTIPL